jgi:hypothetical protein
LNSLWPLSFISELKVVGVGVVVVNEKLNLRHANWSVLHAQESSPSSYKVVIRHCFVIGSAESIDRHFPSVLRHASCHLCATTTPRAYFVFLALPDIATVSIVHMRFVNTVCREVPAGTVVVGEGLYAFEYAIQLDLKLLLGSRGRVFSGERGLESASTYAAPVSLVK